MLLYKALCITINPPPQDFRALIYDNGVEVSFVLFLFFSILVMPNGDDLVLV